jgi:protein phosphatase
MDFEYFGFSDRGKARGHNEDSYLCNETEGLFLVADGMGGHASGETASQLAVKSVEEFIIRSRSENVDWPIEYHKDLTPEQNRLLAAATFANRQIHGISRQYLSKRGMGTTFLGILVEDNYLAVVNVGDTRLYRIRERNIKQLTEDHTLVGEQEREGMLTKDRARRHPHRHILTSALGIDKRPQMDVFLAEIMPSDIFLLCSDGLHEMLDDREILANINSTAERSLSKIGLSLVSKANEAGGLDNITVILLSF